MILPSSPCVSVCIPTYNGEAYLANAIESVLSQTFGNYELLIIDDNSRGDIERIVCSFSDARLVYIRNERNFGPEGNWNRCLQVARGRYFKLLPHDDLLHPTCLEQQVTILDEDRDERIALTFCAREVIAPSGRVLMRRGYPGNKAGALGRHAVMRSCVRRGTNLLGEPGAIMFRKKLADRIGPFDATNPYVIDLDYWFRLLAHGDAYYCTDSLASFRVSDQSWSKAIGLRQSREFLEFLARVDLQDKRITNRVDHLCGKFMSHANTMARHLFYKLYLK